MGDPSNVDKDVDGLQEYSTLNNGNIPIWSYIWKENDEPIVSIKAREVL